MTENEVIKFILIGAIPSWLITMLWFKGKEEPHIDHWTNNDYALEMQNSKLRVSVKMSQSEIRHLQRQLKAKTEIMEKQQKKYEDYVEQHMVDYKELEAKYYELKDE